MENKIPLPTDNIYKFYALFALFLLIFSFAATLYANRSSNEQIIGLLLQIEDIKQATNLTEAQATLRKDLLTRQLEIATSDKKFFRCALAVMAAFALYGMLYGFAKWHREVQPLADEAARVQLQLAKLELARRQSEAAQEG
jgi:hypothetical protein